MTARDVVDFLDRLCWILVQVTAILILTYAFVMVGALLASLVADAFRSLHRRHGDQVRRELGAGVRP